MSDLIHFALSNHTACNEYIVGSTIDWYEDIGEPITRSHHGKNVYHTCIVEEVTCDKCRESAIYLEYLKTLEDDYIS